MLKKTSGPSSPKMFFDTQIVPLATNAAGGLEVLLDRSAVRTGVRPSIILAGVAGLGSLILFRLWQFRRPAGSRLS